MTEQNLPLVSICCITYNHENFIRDAIEGFLMQKTDFNFEIIIHDDASMDKTVEILSEYEKKYSNVIKVVYQQENQYSKGIGGIAAKFVYPLAQGKYIALCEGDDYWIDPNKLQKQVNFLEANSEYGMVHTNHSLFFQKQQKLVENKSNNYVPEGWVLNDIFKGDLNIKTATVCFRRELYEKYFPANYWDLKIPIGDWPLWLVLAKHSKIGYIADTTAIYRVGQFSYVNYQAHNFNKIEKRYEDEERMYKFMCNLYPDDLIYDETGYFMFKNISLLKAAIKKNDFIHAKEYGGILKNSGLNNGIVKFSQYRMSFLILVLYKKFRSFMRLKLKGAKV